jgi:hypothetical protein
MIQDKIRAKYVVKSMNATENKKHASKLQKSMRIMLGFIYLSTLDQVLREHWSCLTIFGTSTGWSKMERPGELRSRDLTCFAGFLGF